MKKFRAKTSIGDVYVELDETKGEKDIIFDIIEDGIETVIFHWKHFKVIEPENSSIKLYKTECGPIGLYKGSPYCVRKYPNGDYFLEIELDDSYYGTPEYYLEEISDGA